MKLYADLHLHSHYSRATSREMNLEGMSKYARLKGINLLGTGDFQHPKWLEELKGKLRMEDGFYKYNDIYFVLQTEISSIYSHNGKTRKIHHVVLAPDLDTAEKLQKEFMKWGRIDYDGRPIFGKSSKEVVKTVMAVDSRCEVIPAHIWTPWFGLFGSHGGYDSMKECYEEEIKHIHALETGLSSDPPMNWRIRELDNYNLVSNSDSHSPWPWRMGRECNIFDVNSYDSLIRAIRTGQGLLGTIEVDPAYGKYHWDGHRNCNFSSSPARTKELKGICPVCKNPLTIGVEHRVEELADRPAGYKPEKAKPFKELIPLAEIIARFIGKGVNTKAVWNKYMEWIDRFGNEFYIMLDAPEEEILSFDRKIGSAILMTRKQEVKVKPGFDGEYGVPVFGNQEKLSNFL